MEGWHTFKELQYAIMKVIIQEHDRLIAEALLAGKTVLTITNRPWFAGMEETTTVYCLQGKDDAERQRLVEKARKFIAQTKELK